jgi:hypothetical protein
MDLVHREADIQPSISMNTIIMFKMKFGVQFEKRNLIDFESRLNCVFDIIISNGLGDGPVTILHLVA